MHDLCEYIILEGVTNQIICDQSKCGKGLCGFGGYNTIFEVLANQAHGAKPKAH